jgi:ABC-type dipeptide/oligopeptide/nickel transport system ATPase component
VSAPGTNEAAQPVILLERVDVEIGRRPPRKQILRGVSLALQKGEMHGLVGETGSGKSMTARAVIGLLPRYGLVTGGRILVQGVDVTAYDDEQMRAIRGGVIGMVFQNPRAALYPLRSVAGQMGAVLNAHNPTPRRARLAPIHELLRLVGIRDPARVAAAYPHQLSGGMAQRVVIATALIAEPEVLVADEPTTGLDATVQRQILELLASLQARLGLSVLMITHDLGIVAQYCHTVSVMYQGSVVEDGTMRKIITMPEHEYTRRLVAASRLSDVDTAREAAAQASG